MTTRKLIIKEGRYYARADGSVHGPMERRIAKLTDNTLKWEAPDGMTYRDDGGYVWFGSNARDLVREVPALHAKPAKPAKAKARKREMVVRWAYSTPLTVEVRQSKQGAIDSRAFDLRQDIACGPITKISIPAPSGKGEP